MAQLRIPVPLYLVWHLPVTDDRQPSDGCEFCYHNFFPDVSSKRGFLKTVDTKSNSLMRKQLEIHGCVLSTVSTDDFVLKHQAISILTADKI